MISRLISFDLTDEYHDALQVLVQSEKVEEFLQKCRELDNLNFSYVVEEVNAYVPYIKVADDVKVNILAENSYFEEVKAKLIYDKKSTRIEIANLKHIIE